RSSTSSARERPRGAGNRFHSWRNVAMYPNELNRLAERLGMGCPDNPGKFREVVEACLVPIIRVAIRSGTGQPWLVSWVRRNLPAGAGPRREAPWLARQLCDGWLEQQNRLSATETVVGV